VISGLNRVGTKSMRVVLVSLFVTLKINFSSVPEFTAGPLKATIRSHLCCGSRRRSLVGFSSRI
jgi:hypothetical protein